MKERIVSFRITDSEYSLLKQRAQENGKTMSEFLRHRIRQPDFYYTTFPPVTTHSINYPKINTAVASSNITWTLKDHFG